MSEPQSLKEVFNQKLYKHDEGIVLQRGIEGIIGVDEVGRGCLAGPVIAAAVKLNLKKRIDGINDSKKLSSSVRESLYLEITEHAQCWATGTASCKEIDKYNILQASLLAMNRAIEKLNCKWDLVLVDGNKKIPYITFNMQETVVGGDAKSASIGAASIVAKVVRDRIMCEYHEKYPVYQFNKNKGYATEYHRESIIKNGLCEIHRKSFCGSLFQTRLPL